MHGREKLEASHKEKSLDSLDGRYGAASWGLGLSLCSFLPPVATFCSIPAASRPLNAARQLWVGTAGRLFVFPFEYWVYKSREGRGVWGRGPVFPLLRLLGGLPCLWFLPSSACVMGVDGCRCAWPKPSPSSCLGMFPNSHLCFPWGNLDLAEAARCQLLTCPRLLLGAALGSFPQYWGVF